MLRSIGLPELLVIVVVGVVVLVPTILYMLALQKALERCSPESRTMSPGKVWLLLIPVFGLVWHFVLVSNIAKSFETECARRGLPTANAATTKTWGLVMCSLHAGSIVPFLGVVLAIGGLGCWIVYWVRINQDSRQLVPLTG